MGKSGPDARPGGYNIGLHFQTAAETLAAAIIMQAVEDYRKCLKRKTPATYEGHWMELRDSLEKFFRGRWFGILTSLDGEILMERLQKEMESGGKKRIRVHVPDAREASFLIECGLNPSLYFVEREEYPYLYIQDKKRCGKSYLTVDMERKMIAHSRMLK